MSFIEKDVHVYNDTSGLVLTSPSLGGLDPDLFEPLTTKSPAFAQGAFLPIGLAESTCLNIRVIRGRALTEQENAEWILHGRGRLSLPDGRLWISAGESFLLEPRNRDCGSLRTIKVATGDYVVDVYCYLPCVNAYLAFDRLEKNRKPVGEWFRKTRPDEEFPIWLQCRCMGKPDEDPGREREWQRTVLDSRSTNAEFIHFLVHLQPLRAKDPLPAKREWFQASSRTRIPSICPLGLKAKGIRQPTASRPRKVRAEVDVPESVTEYPPRAYIKIVGVPTGQAPLWVRKAWEGCVLPLAWDDQSAPFTPSTDVMVARMETPLRESADEALAGLTTWGVAGAPIWGFLVFPPEAFEVLGPRNRKALDWWIDHFFEDLFEEGPVFVFGGSVCTRLSNGSI